MRNGVWLAVLVVAIGCGSKKSDQEADTESGDKGPLADKAADKPAPDKAKPKAPDDIDEATAQNTLEAWLAAQNKGDFDAYKALYAEQFFGIKRVGDKKTSYDRDGWLKDRGRMFKNKMVVEATGVTISTNPTTAVVHFTQTWSSGKFRDQGPKQLILVDNNGTLEISREEMLQSQPAPALAAWAKAAQPNQQVQAKDVPKEVAAELTALSDGIAGDDKVLGVQWVMAMSATLVAFQIDSEKVYEDEDQRPYWQRTPSAHLVVVADNKGKFVVTSTVEEDQVSYDLRDSDDHDGDGVADAVFKWDWFHDHEGAAGVAIVLSKSRSASMIKLAESGGEGGYFLERELGEICWLMLDSRPAFALIYTERKGEPEDEDHPYDSETIETVEYGFLLHRSDEHGVFSSSPAFGHWVKKSDDELDGDCRAGTIVVPAQVIGQKQGYYSVTGLATTRDAAAAKAKAAKLADHVVEL